MKLLSIIILLVLVSSCDQVRTATSPAWQEAPETHACTSEQLKLVKMELDVCQTTSFMSSYCYGAALIKHCSKVTQDK